MDPVEEASVIVIVGEYPPVTALVRGKSLQICELISYFPFVCSINLGDKMMYQDFSCGIFFVKTRTPL